MSTAGASLLKTFRVYAIIAGVLVLLFWVIYRISDPGIIDPLWMRVVLSLVTFTLLWLSFKVSWVRARFVVLMKALLCFYTVWIIGLNVVNGFSPNYVVALLFVIAAIGVAVGTGLRRTEPIIYYLLFATFATSLAVFLADETAFGAVGRVIVIACVASMALVIYVATRASVIAQAQLSRTNETLLQRNRELQQFTSAASHDLREPLRKIQTFADLLRTEHRAELSDESADYLQRIEATAGHMSRVVAALLEFSQVTDDKSRFTRVDLNGIVEDVVIELGMDLGGTHTHVDVDRLPEVLADPAQMHVLFLELLKNAIAYRKKTGMLRVTITAEELSGTPQPHHRITIRDNGTGFEQKYATRIFAPFERLQIEEGHDGAGMGLTICRRIVSLHGGTLTVESNANSGSLFAIELPADPSGITDSAAPLKGLRASR